MLKVGCGNDALVKQWLTGALQARVAGMELFDLGRYPGMLKSQAPTDFVYGEYQEFNDMPAALARLDRLEGYREERGEKNFYQRVVVEVELAFGETVEAYTYLINKPSVRNRCERCEDGVWISPSKKGL
jgi:gamma-glutamylcyclotransferase (GGCT)/AIG2-like uncharacterized protein YtfP